MKATIITTGILALLSALTLTGCQKDALQAENDYIGEQIAVTAQTDGSSDTRTILKDLRTEWVAGDQIGVFSSQAGASNLSLSAASSAASSAFHGEMRWGSSTHDFYAYYPHTEGSFAATAIPVSLPASQTQKTGGDSGHIGALDFVEE